MDPPNSIMDPLGDPVNFIIDDTQVNPDSIRPECRANPIFPWRGLDTELGPIEIFGHKYYKHSSHFFSVLHSLVL